MHSVVIANRIDSPREYFQVLYFYSGVSKWFIVVQFPISSTNLTATREDSRLLWIIKVLTLIKDFNFRIMFQK